MGGIEIQNYLNFQAKVLSLALTLGCQKAFLFFVIYCHGKVTKLISGNQKITTQEKGKEANILYFLEKEEERIFLLVSFLRFLYNNKK